MLVSLDIWEDDSSGRKHYVKSILMRYCTPPSTKGSLLKKSRSFMKRKSIDRKTFRAIRSLRSIIQDRLLDTGRPPLSVDRFAGAASITMDQRKSSEQTPMLSPR